MELTKYKLGDVCTFINGRAYSQPELLDSGKYKVLRVGNIFDGNHWYYSDMELEEDKYCNEGDLLYSWACTFGPYIWHGPKTIYHYHIWKVKPNDSLVDKSFLYYFLNHQTKGFMGCTHGSTMIHITKENMENFEVLLPSLKDQKKIASVLSALDDKIALNKKMNQKLEAMAKRLYDYWFVQYDFPDKNGHPYKTSGGKMVYNDQLKREIPEGWQNGKIGDLFESQAGYAFKSSEWKECGHPVLTIKNIQSDGSVSFDDASYIDCFKDGLAKYSVDNGNMIFAMSGNTIGKIGIIASSVKHVLINQRVLIIKTSTSDIAFPFLTIMNGKVQNLVFQLGANSAQPNISEDELRNVKICLPPKELLEDFNILFKCSFEQIINNRIEIMELTTLRDRLLPLLMNGQVVVG